MTSSIVWQVLASGWFASEVILGVATRTKRGTGNVRDRGSLIILWIVIVAAVTLSQWIGDSQPRNMFGGAHWLRTVGIIIMLAGLAIRWTAIVSLGKAFSSNVAIRDSQKIKKNGLYRFIRHPSYLGLLLVFLAVGVHSRNWIAFAAAFLPTTAAMLYRIHVEEGALRSAFGEEYVAYSRGTKRLVPGLY
jgi:protein-S-isoprenylcysteine O-methyltransferase Ste14